MFKLKISLFSLSTLLLAFSSTAYSIVSNGEHYREQFEEEKRQGLFTGTFEEYGFEEYIGEDILGSFKVNNKTIQLRTYTNNQDVGTNGCPRYYIFTDKNQKRLSPYFGTCAYDLDSVKQIGNKIIVKMNDWTYVFGSAGRTEALSKKERKEAEEIIKRVYQYTYENGKVTEKRIK